MTRNEFLENVTTWGELKDFCYEQDCGICDDVYDEEDRDDYINSCLADWAREDNWRDLYRRMDNIPSGYDYYRYDDYGDWSGLDDTDFDSYKSDALEWGDDNGAWDADDADEDYNDFEDEPSCEKEESEPTPEEDFSIRDLMNMCGSELVTIQKATEQHRKEEDENMVRLLAV